MRPLFDERAVLVIAGCKDLVTVSTLGSALILDAFRCWLVDPPTDKKIDKIVKIAQIRRLKTTLSVL